MILLDVTIALLPLITFKGYFEQPKVFTLSIIAIFIVIYFIYKIWLKHQTIKLNKADKYYLIWVVILSASSLLGNDSVSSIMGTSYRKQGVLFFLSLWLISKYIQSLSTNSKSVLYKLVAVSVIVQSFIVVTGNPLGTIGEVNAVAAFLSLGLYFVYKPFSIWLIILPIFGIFYENSKSAVLSLLGYLNLPKKLMTLFVSIAILGGVIYAIKITPQTSVIENRNVIWKHAVNAIYHKPLIGYGAESGETVFNKEFRKTGIYLDELIIDRSHNLILDILMWSGVFGIIPFLFFLKNIKKSSLVYAFLIFSMFQPLSIVHWTLFFLVI